MLETHELGHALHAWVSGGQVTQVSLPLVGISRTDVAPNPSPRFVAWGGAVWGVLLPLAAWLGARWLAPRYEFLARFVAGFCLVTNGAYLGAGAIAPVGDAADLLNQGARPWQLAAYGLAATALGLRLWHGMGPKFGWGASAPAVDCRAALIMGLCALTAALIAAIVGR